MLKTRDKPKELVLWRRIHHFFHHDGDRAYRIETTTISGFPDVIWFPVDRPAVLIELKAGPLIFGKWQNKMFREMTGIGHTVWVIWQKQKNFAPIVYPAMALIDWDDSFEGQDLLEWIAEKREPR